jgi:hypothetical protein
MKRGTGYISVGVLTDNANVESIQRNTSATPRGTLPTSAPATFS